MQAMLQQLQLQIISPGGIHLKEAIMTEKAQQEMLVLTPQIQVLKTTAREGVLWDQYPQVNL